MKSIIAKGGIALFESVMYNSINNIVVMDIHEVVYMPEVNSLLNNALMETEKLQPGEVFLIRDLFRGYEWNRISRSERLLLGTLFLNHVKSFSTGIDVVEKTSSGQQKYTKR